MGNREWEMGNGKWKMGNGKWEMEKIIAVRDAVHLSPFPISHVLFPYSPFAFLHFVFRISSFLCVLRVSVPPKPHFAFSYSPLHSTSLR